MADRSMIDHEEAVQHVRNYVLDKGHAMSGGINPHLRYVCDMADTAKRLKMAARDAVNLYPDLLGLADVLASLPKEKP